MEKIRRTLALILCVAMSLVLLAGCGEKASGPQTTGKNDTPQTNNPSNVTEEDVEYAEELIVVSHNKAAVIDPRNTSGTGSGPCWCYNMIYDTLVECTVDGEYVPRLATSWDTTDYQHYTIKLRDDVYFHNGEKFTAADVAFTIDSAKAATGTLTYDRFSPVDTYEIVNDYEIKLTLTDVNVDFIAGISYPVCGILGKKALEDDPETGTWIGTGRYVLTDFVSNDYASFERNEDYWGEIPKTQKFTIKTIAEQSARNIMLENNEAQIVYNLDPNEFPLIEADDRFVTYSYVSNSAFYLGFNMLDPLMSDINFRMAVAHAINRDDMVMMALNGYARIPETGAFWGPATEFLNSDVPFISHDVDKAKEYLAKSSYNGETVEIVAALSEMTKSAQIVQANLEAIGVKVSITETDTAGLQAYAKWSASEPQIIMTANGWQLAASTSKTFFYPGVSANRANYNNSEVAELLEKAAVTLDATKREQLYRQVQEITGEEIPYLLLFNAQHVICCQAGVAGIKTPPDVPPQDFSYAYMIKQ